MIEKLKIKWLSPVFIACLFIIGFCFPIFAFNPLDDPDYVESLKIFDDSSVALVEITIAPEDLTEILRPGNEESDIYFPASLHFKNAQIDDTITTVGFRLRGNTSRYAKKKSFKVSFNEFIGGRAFHGLRKFNLNGEHNDPSIIRSKLCWDLFGRFGVPASRASHTRLYVNGEYKGLYINVENIDKYFVKSRFGNSKGNLFKCLYLGAPADLTYRSDGRYDLVGDGTTYVLEINEETPDFSDLAHFIDVLNNSPDAQLPTELEKVFNVKGFLQWMAVSTNCGSWDDYLWNANNYYLYHNQDTGKFEFIPYDYDNTMGISWGPRDWATRNVFDFYTHSSPRPLASRILAHQPYVTQYNIYLHSLIANSFSLPLMEPDIDRIKTMIRPAAADDLYRTYDYGWTMTDFDKSYTQALGGHVVYGLKPFITTRYNSTLKQLAPMPSPTPTPTPSPTASPTPTPTATPIDQCTTITLLINEFCADNDSVIQDNAGQYDDWIEIYNYGTESVDMLGMYLTDDPTNPTKCKITQSIVIKPKSFKILWADDNTEQGADHLTIKLSKSGEAVGLFDRDECANRKIDLIVFGEQTTDNSYGRLPDGSPIWQVFAKPTPGTSNIIAILKNSMFLIY